jgi:hypothetical protein
LAPLQYKGFDEDGVVVDVVDGARDEDVPAGKSEAGEPNQKTTTTMRRTWVVGKGRQENQIEEAGLPFAEGQRGDEFRDFLL